MGSNDVSKPFIEKFDYEKLDLEDPVDDNVSQARTRIWSAEKLAIISIFLLSIVCLIASAIIYTRAVAHYTKCSDENNLLRSTINYSPIIKSHIPFRLTQFTSAPLSSYNDSIYRQPPSPSVDVAWDRLADIGTHIISSSEVIQLGKDPTKAVKVPSNWGYGDDAHIATIDGIHLVHCLNSMRKSLKLNFDYYHPDPLGPEYLPHLSHCVEALLQHLMCRPSLELLTQNWIERQNAPFPDFGINKKCWDYEAILEWKERNRVLDIERRFKELKPPEGTTREPLPPLVAETWEIIEGNKENST